MPTDQPTGPAVADEIAGRMPGWKRRSDGSWKHQPGRCRFTGDRDQEHRRWHFWPDRDAADAVEALEAVARDWSICRIYGVKVICSIVNHDTAVSGEAAGDDERALCEATCAAIRQLPLAREGREDAK